MTPGQKLQEMLVTFLEWQPRELSVEGSAEQLLREDNHIVEHVPAHSVVRHSLGPLRVGTTGCRPGCHSRLNEALRSDSGA